MQNENKIDGERLARVETKLESVEELLTKQDKRIERLEEHNKSLNKMELILEQQVEQNKEQHAVLRSMNENLSNLNTTQIQMQEEMKVVNGRIDKVEENHVKIENKGKFDVTDFLTNKVVPAILFAVVVGLLALIGLKP